MSKLTKHSQHRKCVVMSRLILVLIITAAACFVDQCSGRQHRSADLPRKWLAAADKKPTQSALMDPCHKERSMKMICHCEHKAAGSDAERTTEIGAAECWILKNDFTAMDPLWQAFDKYTAMTELKFIVQSGDLKFVPTLVFKKLVHLQDVSISFSNINHIDSFAFANSSSLRTIRLNHNNLTTVGRFAFANHGKVERIDLQENDLKSVDQSSFSNLTKLEYLALSINKLSEISRGTFRELNNLVELQLHHNLLATITSDMFLGLGNLRMLKLSSNHIKSIGNGVFTELWSLQELHLDNNKIEKIFERAFDGLNNLRRLSLQRNQLKFLERTVFTSLPVISWLNLSANRLKTLHHGTFSTVVDNFEKADSSLSFSDNELICDCKLNWLIELRNRTRSQQTQQSLDHLKCLLAAGNNIPEELLLNAIEPIGSDYISDELVDTDGEQVRAVDLGEGSLVNLFLLENTLPCHGDESDPTSLPMPRESTGFHDSSGKSVQTRTSFGTVIIIFSAFVICILA